MNFENKVVLITGAGSGIGEAIAIHFAQLSAKLSLIDLNLKNLNEVVKECERVSKLKVFKVSTDLGDIKNVKDAVNATIQEYGRIDVVVNCAGRSGSGGITSVELLDNLHNVLDVNLVSHIAVTHYASEALIKSKGCVVNISSIFGTTVIKGGIPYTVSKAAMIHFTKCAALELGEKGVRVNSISPGPVNTLVFTGPGDIRIRIRRMNIRMRELQNQEVTDKFWDNMGEQTPLKQLVQAKEIAEMVEFLASDKARSITGIDYIVDSGMSLQKLDFN